VILPDHLVQALRPQPIGQRPRRLRLQPRGLEKVGHAGKLTKFRTKSTLRTSGIDKTVALIDERPSLQAKIMAWVVIGAFAAVGILAFWKGPELFPPKDRASFDPGLSMAYLVFDTVAKFWALRRERNTPSPSRPRRKAGNPTLERLASMTTTPTERSLKVSGTIVSAVVIVGITFLGPRTPGQWLAFGAGAVVAAAVVAAAHGVGRLWARPEPSFTAADTP
jgi:hypothetical protein